MNKLPLLVIIGKSYLFSPVHPGFIKDQILNLLYRQKVINYFKTENYYQMKRLLYQYCLNNYIVKIYPLN